MKTATVNEKGMSKLEGWLKDNAKQAYQDDKSLKAHMYAMAEKAEGGYHEGDSCVTIELRSFETASGRTETLELRVDEDVDLEDFDDE